MPNGPEYFLTLSEVAPELQVPTKKMIGTGFMNILIYQFSTVCFLKRKFVLENYSVCFLIMAWLDFVSDF